MGRALVVGVAFALVVAGCSGADGGGRAAGRATTSTTDANGLFGISGIRLPHGVEVPSTMVDPHPLARGAIDDAMAVAAGLNEAGLGCQIARLEPRVGGGPDAPEEQVDCTVGDDSIVVSRWRDRTALAGAWAYLHASACVAITDGDPATHVNATYVEGDNWIVFPERAATARRIASALGVPAKTITC